MRGQRVKSSGNPGKPCPCVLCGHSGKEMTAVPGHTGGQHTDGGQKEG